jgi:hypothetical protein
MRHVLGPLRDAEPKVPWTHALGVLTRLTRADGVPGRRALVVASVLAGVVLSSAAAAPGAAQVISDPGTLTVMVVARDPDSPVATDADDRVPAPGSIARAADDPDGLIHLQLVPGDSELRYIISMRTLLQPAQASACATRNVTGELVLTADGALVGDLSTIVADMRTMHCAPPLRDSSAQALLETQKYPTAEATFDQAPGLPVPLRVGDVAGQLIGQQSMHGVTRHAEYATTATFSSSDVIGHATTSEKFTNFNIKPPQIGPLFSVMDDLTIEVDFHTTINR